MATAAHGRHPEIKAGMDTMKKICFSRFILYAIIMPLISFYYMHIWSITNYTRGLFNVHNFNLLYNHGIYRYRVLGRILLIWIYDMLRLLNLYIPVPGTNTFKAIDANFDSLFYLAYCILNGLSFLLFSMIAYKIIGAFGYAASSLLAYVLLQYLVNLSFFVVVPYDMLQYFFLSASVWLFHNRNSASWPLFSLAIIFGVMTRETQFLILSYSLAILFYTPSNHFRHYATKLLVAAITSMLVYIGLRLIYGFDNGIIQEVKMNLSALGSIGLFTMIITPIIVNKILSSIVTHRAVLMFYCFSLPYVLAVIVSGNYIEFRLIVPLVILNIFVILYVQNIRSKGIEPCVMQSSGA